jgi:exodeoxyribonuclease V alpha subunit
MATHLSVRLVWHDRGWDGHICNNPSGNAYCAVHEHVRDSRDDGREDLNAGKPLAGLQGWQPPCSRDPVAFSQIGYTITHHDPLDRRNLPSRKEEIPPYSVCPSPYRWMREENFRQICEEKGLAVRTPDDAQRESGWVREPDRQLALLSYFWERIERRSSLVFFYTNHGNPVEEGLNRILIGVGRIAEVGPQLYFGRKPPKFDDDYPIWSRRVTHDFENEGLRLPYQEYVAKGLDPAGILCTIPDGTMLNFSYVAEHVSDDTAVGALERLCQAVEAVRDEKQVPGDWRRHLVWLNDVLSEVWNGRGPFPGLGSVLEFLGMDLGTVFQRQVLSGMPDEGKDPWDYLKAVLEGQTRCRQARYAEALRGASERWAAYPSSRHKLLSVLGRMELSPAQVRRIANHDERFEAGIRATDEELVDNPYLIAEMDLGGEDHDPVALEVVDRVMRPEGNAALFRGDENRVAQDDPRRVRGCAVDVLKTASANGDTLLSLDGLLGLIRDRFPNLRACNPDRDLVLGQQDLYSEALSIVPETEPITVALRHLADSEREVASRLARRIDRRNEPAPVDWSWEQLLANEFGEGKGTDLPKEIEERARTEKAKALEILFGSRFSVLTGRAGTGKTSVLKVFLEGLEHLEGKRPVLLLAPTGKARVRLVERTKRKDGTTRDAFTIHQFLVRNDWVNRKNFALRIHGGKQVGIPTVIVDEASMVSMDLLGVLFRALDLNQVSRLILVGDPNQLPPIGPGRPFVDIIAWMQEDEDRASHLARLDERARQEDQDSQALQLADAYLGEDPPPGYDELLSKVARQDLDGDLQVHFWENQEDLQAHLSGSLSEHLHLEQGPKPYEKFNESMGLGDTKKPDAVQAENWQILSPVRSHEHGATELNRKIQLQYKRGLIGSGWDGVRPFGDEEIVWTDKVIQVVNGQRRGWPQGAGLNYVANGEIGLVTRTSQSPECLDVTFSTQPEVSYRYYRSHVTGNLELAYALTVHKAQGSDFDIVFLILPREAATLSRELLYTGLTRFRKKMVLLIQHDTRVLEQFRKVEASDTLLRNTHLFTCAVRPDGEGQYYANHLIHRTAKGVLVRSKSEVIVADTLTRLGISYEYEQKLPSRNDPRDFRLPDFTVSYEGDAYYWEHNGMLSVPSYRVKWEKKREWYEANRYEGRLITSEDGPDGSIDVKEIERTATEHILQG